MNRQRTAEVLRKKALDALLETMGTTYPHDDPDYSNPFAGKGTELDSNHTDQITIPAKDFRASVDVPPVEQEVEEHEFLKESIEYEDLKSIRDGSENEVRFSEYCAEEVNDDGFAQVPRQPFMGKYEIAKKDKGDKGIYVVYDKDNPIARLQPGWFGVLPEYRNKGIGTELVKQYTQQYPNYKPEGFSPAGRRTFEKALMPEYQMVRASAIRPAYVVQKKAAGEDYFAQVPMELIGDLEALYVPKEVNIENAPTESFMGEYTLRKGKRCYVVYDKEKRIAVLYPGRFAVARKYRNKGVGTALLTKYKQDYPDYQPAGTSDMSEKIYKRVFKASAGTKLYHVTHTSQVSKIKKEGLRPMQTSNWVKGTGEERYGAGEIYAFENAADAVRWAAKMDWEFNKSMGTGKVSIVVISTDDEEWDVDTNDPASQIGAKGKWLKHLGAIPADRIIKVVKLTPDLVKASIAGQDVKLAAIDDRTRKNQYEKLYKRWKEFQTSLEDKQPDLAVIQSKAPIGLDFIEKLEALKPTGNTLFEGAGVTFENVTPNLQSAKQNLSKALKAVEELQSEWAHRAGFTERDVRWWFNNAIATIQMAFHNLGVEYFYMSAPRDENGKIKSSATKSYGMGTPIGGTPNVPETDEDQPEEDEKTAAADVTSAGEIVRQGGGNFLGVEAGFVWFNDPVTHSTLVLTEDELSVEAVKTKVQQNQDKFSNPKSFDITASFGIVAFDYKPMFTQILAAKPDLEATINGEIAWAKSILKKQDRITWFLRWVRLYLERRWAGGSVPAITQMFDKDIAAYSKKNPITVNDIPTDMGGWKRSLEHWMSLQDKAIQNKIFAFETFAQLSTDLNTIEAEIEERQESERRIVKHNDDEDEVFMRFPNGWVWFLLPRASCDAEAAAMGHCGNSPRSDSEDTILSLRQPVQTPSKTNWSPHLTFILDKRNVLGEMKGRNNNKPVAKYHPYIIALLKDERIRGVKGGGYRPENNFKLSDLTEQQQQEIAKANPQIFNAPATPEEMAEAMGLEGDDAWRPAHKLFVVREWGSVRRMVQDLGNGEAESAVNYAIDEAENKLEADGTYTIGDKDIPDVDDIADELAKTLSSVAMRNIGLRLEKESGWLLDDFARDSHVSRPLDYNDSDMFYRLMLYLGQRADNSPTWKSIIEGYREGREVKYKQYRVGDLEYLIEHDVYETADERIYTEFRYGPDFSSRLDWLAEPCWEVITYKDATELLGDPDVDHGISEGQIKSLYLYEQDYSDRDDDNEEAADLVDEWYTKGFPREKDERQMEMQFKSSLLKKKKALVPVKETPKFLPQRDDMRRHLDEETKDEVMEGVMDGPPARKPRQRPQINPNIPINAAFRSDDPEFFLEQRDEEFQDKVEAAKQEAYQVFLQEGYLKQEAQERNISMSQLWKEVGEEFTNEYFASKDNR